MSQNVLSAKIVSAVNAEAGKGCWFRRRGGWEVSRLLVIGDQRAAGDERSWPFVPLAIELWSASSYFFVNSMTIILYSLPLFGSVPCPSIVLVFGPVIVSISRIVHAFFWIGQ